MKVVKRRKRDEKRVKRGEMSREEYERGLKHRVAFLEPVVLFPRRITEKAAAAQRSNDTNVVTGTTTSGDGAAGVWVSEAGGENVIICHDAGDHSGGYDAAGCGSGGCGGGGCGGGGCGGGD